MRLFITHMPGFTPDTWGVVSFPSNRTVTRLQQAIGEISNRITILS
jgi:hypothetical protein